MPPAVAIGESVPVARWSGPRFGAVLHLQWIWSDDHDDDYLATEVEVFRRDEDGSWEVASGSGGSDWPPEFPLMRPEVPPDYATIGASFRTGENGWACCAFDGTVGVDAVAIEVEAPDGIARHAIDSPLGIALAAVDGDRPATIRVLGRHGQVLATEHFDGGWS